MKQYQVKLYNGLYVYDSNFLTFKAAVKAAMQSFDGIVYRANSRGNLYVVCIARK